MYICLEYISLKSMCIEGHVYIHMYMHVLAINLQVDNIYIQ